MNINEEKEYLYSMMSNIMEERRKLTEQYYDLKKRLDFLNSLEERGLEELSIQGYIDLHKKLDKELSSRNIQREAQNAIRKINEQNEEKTKEQVISKKINEEKIKRKPKRKAKISREKAISSIIEILKEEGRPIKNEELRLKLEERLDLIITKNNFDSNIIRNAKKHPKIENIMKGYYQYKF